MRQFISATVLGMRLASILLVAYWTVLFIGTHTPSMRLPSFSSADKFYHFGAFMGLTVLLAWALPKNRLYPKRHLIIALGIAAGYGMFDELTQMFVRGRSTELLDFIADCAGALTGLVVYLILRRVVSRKGRSSSIPQEGQSPKMIKAGARP